MPDLNIGDNTSALRKQIQDAAAQAAVAAVDATTAKSQASSAQAETTVAKGQAATAASDAASAKSQAASAMAAMPKVQRVTLTTPALTVAASIAELIVAWPVSFADANYSVIVTPWVAAGLIGKWTAQPKYGTQTASGCTVVVSSLGLALAAGQTLDVLAIRA